MVLNLFLERRKAFEAKRKGHYREWEAVQLARKKLLEEDDEEDEEKSDVEKELNVEETEKDEDNDSDERETNTGSKKKCVLSISGNETQI